MRKKYDNKNLKEIKRRTITIEKTIIPSFSKDSDDLDEIFRNYLYIIKILYKYGRENHNKYHHQVGDQFVSGGGGGSSFSSQHCW